MNPTMMPDLQGLEQVDALGLSFDSHEDALNFGRECVQDAQVFMSSHRVNLPERYINGDIEIVLRVTPMKHAEEHHLVLGAIPNWGTVVFASHPAK